MSDAYARKNQPVQEFALYDDLLKELASAADGVPIGEAPAAAESAAPPSTPGQTAQAQPARSPEYARILDRYISRLVSMKRLRDALALYRSEIDRNPNDPGFVRTARRVPRRKQVGQRSGADLSPCHVAILRSRLGPEKLARWYLKHKRTAEFDQLTQEVVKDFLSAQNWKLYIREITSGQTLAPVLYRQV